MPHPPPRVGSLFAGYGGLDLAVETALPGARPVWLSEIAPGPSAILAHRFPSVPNLGDIRRVGLPYTDTEWQEILDDADTSPDHHLPPPAWSAVEPVEILTAGFPCQDVSLAGRRAGIQPGTRSGLFTYVAHAVAHLRPRLVVIENVRGLLSARAASQLEPDPWRLGDDRAVPLRALGAVLGSLADLGYDASWQGLRASDVGAPHERFRVFVVAWPAGDSLDLVGEWGRAVRGERAGRPGQVGGAGRRAAENAGGEPGDERRLAAPGQAERGGARADAGGRGRVAAAPDPDDDERQERPDDGDLDGRGAEEPGRALRTAGARRGRVPGDRDAAGAPATGRETAAEDEADRRGAPADADLVDGRTGRDGHPTVGREGDDEPRGSAPADTARPGSPDGIPAGEDGPGRLAAAERRGRDDRPTAGEAEWGPYRGAVRRWEAVLGRPAPAPTEPGRTAERLSPAFVEWMMGLPDGWVTQVPGLSRAEQIKALGNGVVPQQAAEALRLLLPDVGSPTVDVA